LRKTKAIAIFGGSFDPVHLGHLAVANLVWENLCLDELRFLPCKIAPHKDGFFCEETHRLSMLRIALQETPYFIDDSELKRERVSYSVESMRLLREELGADISVTFIIGGDSLNNLHKWRHWKHLFDYVNVLVVGRPGTKDMVGTEVVDYIENHRAEIDVLTESMNGKIAFLPSSHFDVSSSDIRSALAHSREPKLNNLLIEKLGEPVVKYIQSNDLYI